MGRQYRLDKGFLFLKDWEAALRRRSAEDFHRIFWELYDFQDSRGEKDIPRHPDKPYLDDLVDLIKPRIIDRINGATGGKKAQDARGSVGGLCTQDKIREDKIREDKLSARATHARGKYNNVILTDEQHNALLKSVGESLTSEYIERLSKYLADHPEKTYADHEDTIRSWINEDGATELQGSFDTDSFFEAAVRRSLGEDV